MLSSINLVNFKNYIDSSFNFGKINVICGSNGSGKTNLLEAIYLLTNSKIFLSQPIDELIRFSEGNILISGEIIEDFLEKEYKITFDSKTRKINFIVNKNIVSRSKYLKTVNLTSVFFFPFEINLIYLGPSLRRDFLDETLILSDIVFGKIKSDYLKILKNRNKVLKNIFEKNTTKRELIFWDNAFIEISLKYYDFRKRFIVFIEENIKIIEDMLKNKYKLKFIYETKVDLDNISNSISNYLEKNLDRDILLGYTYIGPHLDNFYFNVIIGNKSYKAENYLSHGENKSILIGLKFLQIAFIQQYNKTDIILLLDDIFSELDKDHIILVMEKCNNYQSFITVQNIPNFLDNNDKIKTINL